MSRSNNMMLRAKIGNDLAVVGFELGNYSGGSTFDLRLHQVANGDLYGVVEGNGYRGTAVVKHAFCGVWDSNDLDELGHEILLLWRTDALEQRDAKMRDLIRRTAGDELPLELPKPAMRNESGTMAI
jgi:hypothetical protein